MEGWGRRSGSAAVAAVTGETRDTSSRVWPVHAAAEGSPGILRRAEALAIPWQRILLAEIEAEESLRRYLADVEEEWALESALAILPLTFFDSWRIRNRIQRLSVEARGRAPREARRRLRLVSRRLLAETGANRPDFLEHLRFAYDRVLLLQRVCRAAARSRGTPEERLAWVCSRTRCCYDDAAWAIAHEDSPRSGPRLEAAVQRVREEGFRIPRAETAARSLAELRSLVHGGPRRVRRSSFRPAVATPQRVRLSDSI
jgi:hypothetical protein